jgi:uncharacterized iron-regulated protein
MLDSPDLTLVRQRAEHVQRDARGEVAGHVVQVELRAHDSQDEHGCECSSTADDVRTDPCGNYLIQ